MYTVTNYYSEVENIFSSEAPEQGPALQREGFGLLIKLRHCLAYSLRCKALYGIHAL